MEKYVIYKDFFRDYCITPLNNYNAAVKDARKIIPIDANTLEDAVNAAEKWMNLSADNLIVKD